MLENDLLDNHSFGHLKFTLSWEGERGHHETVEHVENFNVWRDMDLLPPALVGEILEQPRGTSANHSYVTGDLIPEWKQGEVKSVASKHFTGKYSSGERITPRVGRYYPRGMISGVNATFAGDMSAARCLDIQDSKLLFDCNHPLSSFDLNLGAEIIDVYRSGDEERGGRCNEVMMQLLDGPGMQLPHGNTATDFFTDAAFKRIDEAPDSSFYYKERLVQHLDAAAREQIRDLYKRLIKPGDTVVDLMASWDSHLDDTIETDSVTGIGMNAIELDKNARLSNRLVHDLNQNPVLPLESDSCDVVICTASVEYLTNPLEVFTEVRRILRPGGRFIVTFSNRWFPTKTILLWPEIHEFERIGLVSEYFRQSGWGDAVNSYTCRGLSRPHDDPHYANTQTSDPVFAVWSQKQA